MGQNVLCEEDRGSVGKGALDRIGVRLRKRHWPRGQYVAMVVGCEGNEREGKKKR